MHTQLCDAFCSSVLKGRFKFNPFRIAHGRYTWHGRVSRERHIDIVSMRIFQQNTYFSMHTEAPKQQEGSSCKKVPK